MYGFNIGVCGWREERLSVLADRKIEVTPSEQQRENSLARWGGEEHCLRDLWDQVKNVYILMSLKSLKERRKKAGL